MKKELDVEHTIVNQITSLIDIKYLEHASLHLKENKGDKDSIIISVENNPWRNDVIKGNMLYGRIKTSGKAQYVQISSRYSSILDEINIAYTSNKTEQNEDMIRLGLSDLNALLSNPTELFIEVINFMFINSISFAEFGCCSKYAECEKQGKCLHTDQLYATACQLQKHLKRTGKIE